MKNFVGIFMALIFGALFVFCGTWGLGIPFNFNSFFSVIYWGSGIVMLITAIIFIFTEGDAGPVGVIPLALLSLFILIRFIASSPLVNTDSFAGQLGVGEAKSFKDSDLPVFDTTQIPWVDEQQAAVLADKKLGELGAIGSSVKLGEFTRQEVNGKLYMAAPLLHKGFFAYWKSTQGTPGYILVSMTNTNDVRLVTEIGDKKTKIKVQPAGHAAFGDKLERLIYNYNKSYLYDNDFMFEVSDTGEPCWIVPIVRKTIGWSAPEVTGILIVNASTGVVDEYSVDDAPDWVDRIQPPKNIETQLANWGRYKDGFFNPSNAGRLQSDRGNTLVYMDGNCYLFDSLTSVGTTDESTVGFVLVDLRKKEVKHFTLAGATEWAAQLSALSEEKIKAANYEAGFPIPVMIDGQPTYFFGIQDPNSKITKMFALVNIQKFQLVGLGKTMLEAKTNYLARLRESGQTSFSTSDASLVEIEGVVLRWTAFSQGGETYYRFIIEGNQNKIILTDPSQIEASLTNVGDRVKVKVFKTDESQWSVFSFDNLDIKFDYSQQEQQISENEIQQKLKEVRENEKILDDEKFKEFFNSLNEEQKKEFLENINK